MNDHFAISLINLRVIGSGVVLSDHTNNNATFSTNRTSWQKQSTNTTNFTLGITPSITAASGMAAELGIPLTHRGVANSVRFLTRHSKKGGTHPLYVAESAADPDSTLEIYMGLATFSSLAFKLINHGIPAEPPAAAVERGTTPQQRIAICEFKYVMGTVILAEVIVEKERVKAIISDPFQYYFFNIFPILGTGYKPPSLSNREISSLQKYHELVLLCHKSRERTSASNHGSVVESLHMHTGAGYLVTSLSALFVLKSGCPSESRCKSFIILLNSASGREEFRK
ncbi:Tetrapyrrole methylase [Dillenia turbinata]|uniref:Tetrapyrrole methylase n=1 Tax=Dillenia turbinata TaxID=194707 RepID=A0AAN8ZDE8_9MAGN